MIQFIEGALYHTVGAHAGHPFRLQRWQLGDIIRPLFGTVLEDGRRRYRTALLELPLKNGKSALGSAIALYLLLMDDEAAAHVYSCAADRDQARIVFSGAVKMIEASPEIQTSLRPKVYRDVIEVPATGSIYRVLSADVPTKHGLNPHAVIFDELHAQPNRDLWDVMTSAQGTRRQPLTLAITTAGFDRHSIAWELHEYARQVREGVRTDPTFFSKWFGAPIDADWTDRAVWRAANPALGTFLSTEFLEQEFAQAEAMPGRQNAFRRLYLNQWTEQADRWIDMATWDACGGSLDVDRLRGRACFAGLDLASTRDVTALVLLFPDDEGGFDVVPYFWIPEEGLRDRVRRDKVPYDVWAAEGHLRITDGNVCDYERVHADIRELAEVYDLQSLTYDRWNSTPLIVQLQQDGAKCIPLGQGFASLSAPTKQLEKLILGGQIRHGGHPVLRWMASNAAAETDAAGNVKVSKKKSTEKIDGIVALVMAIDQATREGHGHESVWEDDNYELLTI